MSPSNASRVVWIGVSRRSDWLIAREFESRYTIVLTRGPMNRRTVVLATLVILIPVCTGLAQKKDAQVKEKVGDRLNRVVVTLKQTEPGWKLHSNQPGGRHTIARWQSSEDDVVVSMFVYDTEAEAVAALFE